VIERSLSAQREELESEIGALKAEAERVEEEARELADEVSF
jgi:cell division protein FtsB